jgi:GH18 family chitinase
MRTLQAGLGGIMIWEVGQDCRVHPVTHGQDTHVSTCPKGNAAVASLAPAFHVGVTDNDSVP